LDYEEFCFVAGPAEAVGDKASGVPFYFLVLRMLMVMEAALVMPLK
jgi:hypothetical protein